MREIMSYVKILDLVNWNGGTFRKYARCGIFVLVKFNKLIKLPYIDVVEGARHSDVWTRNIILGITNIHMIF